MPSISIMNSGSPFKQNRPASSGINTSSAALSTAAAVAAMNSNCPIQRVPPNEPQRRHQPNTLVATNGVVNQVFPQHRQPNSINVPQHHLVMNPIHLSPPYPLAGKYTTPSVFTNMKLRRGKWTQEEERFANALIEEFEKGAIQDCENGCTLRAFLSRKLHCAPMRISKKYAGKSIGKHVFLSRNSASSHSHQPMQHNTPKLRRLEFQFHMSLVQEGAPGMEHDSLKMGQALLAGNEFNPMMPSYPMAFRPNVITNEVGSGMNIAPQIQVIPNQPQAVFQWPVTAIPQAGIPTQHVAWQNSAMQMQQSLYTAFKDAHTPSPPRPCSQNTVSMAQSIPSLTGLKGVHAASNPTNMLGKKNCNIGSLLRDCKSKVAASQQLNINTYANFPTHVVATGMKQKDDPISSRSQQLGTTNQTALHHISALGEQKQVSLNLGVKQDWNKSNEHEIWPEETMKATPSVYAQNSLNSCAPPTRIPIDQSDTTSSSIEPYPVSINGKEGLNEDSISDFWCDSLLSADAYALFAQESAMEVSKHSAYCMSDTAVAHRETKSREARSIIDSKCFDSEIIDVSEANNLETEHINDCTPLLLPRKETRQGISTPLNDGAVFNATNLQIHRKEAEEKARVDQASNETRNTVCNTTEHTSINIGETNLQVNIISGSEQSSDMSANSAESSTGVSCAGSGSDNASDDSTSDEVHTSGSESKMAMAREHNIDYNAGNDMHTIGSPPIKRQKLAVLVMDV